MSPKGTPQIVQFPVGFSFSAILKWVPSPQNDRPWRTCSNGPPVGWLVGVQMFGRVSLCLLLSFLLALLSPGGGWKENTGPGASKISGPGGLYRLGGSVCCTQYLAPGHRVGSHMQLSVPFVFGQIQVRCPIYFEAYPYIAIVFENIPQKCLVDRKQTQFTLFGFIPLPTQGISRARSLALRHCPCPLSAPHTP